MKKHKEHLKGRQTMEIKERQWPVVSRRALSDLQLAGGEAVKEDWNPLVHSLAAGLVHLHNSLLWLRKARGLQNLGSELDGRLLVLVNELKEARDKWPLEIL